MPDTITVIDCCMHYNIEVEFVKALHTFGLIELVTVSNEEHLHFEQLSQLEKYIYLHYELEINLQGLDTVNHLLHQIESLQTELNRVKNQL